MGLAYSHLSSGKKPTIVFLHGWGTGKFIWEGAKTHLGDYNQLHIDLPGYGKSDVPDSLQENYLYHAAESIEKLLAKLGIVEILLVGSSIGGLVAHQLSLRLKNNVKKIVFDSTPLLGRYGISLKPRLFSFPLPIRWVMFSLIKSRKITQKMLRDTFFDYNKIDSNIMYEMISGFSNTNRRVLYHSLRDSLEYKLLEQEDDNHIEKLFIAGKNNKTMAAGLIYKKAAEVISNLELKVLDQSAHYPQLDSPKRYYTIIRDFIGEPNYLN